MPVETDTFGALYYKHGGFSISTKGLNRLISKYEEEAGAKLERLTELVSNKARLVGEAEGLHERIAALKGTKQRLEGEIRTLEIEAKLAQEAPSTPAAKGPVVQDVNGVFIKAAESEVVPGEDTPLSDSDGDTLHVRLETGYRDQKPKVSFGVNDESEVHLAAAGVDELLVTLASMRSHLR